MLKKCLALLLAALFTLSLVACQTTPSTEESSLPDPSESSSEVSSEASSEIVSEESSVVIEDESSSEETALPEISSSVSETLSSAASKPASSAATSSKPASSKPSSSAPATSEPASDAVIGTAYGLVTDTMEFQTKPVLTGDFIQGWMYSYWSKKNFVNHFNNLKASGITSLILQYGVHVNNGLIYRIDFENNFPSSYMDPNGVSKYTGLMKNVLEAAKETGCTVWIGLGVADDWWTESNHWKAEWRDRQCEINQIAMQSIIEYYYDDYKDQIAGFYWPNEMYTQNNGLEEVWADMLSKDLDYLTSLNVDLPMMIAPYNSDWYVTGRPGSSSVNDKYELRISADESRQTWTRFVQATRFRDGDIFCPQDGLRTMHIKMEEALDYLIAMKEAVDTSKVDLQFWADVENFDNGMSTAVSDFAVQLEVCAKLATNLVGFSFTHYYSNASGKANCSYYQSQYKRHYKKWMK